MAEIRFGTDGWRAVIAAEFTFERVQRVAQAAARVLSRTYAGNGIVVGYDNRFLSPEFATATAEAIASLGIPVFLANSAAPTPAFSWLAYEQRCHGALVLTASHNPANYGGIKVKGGFGGSVTAALSRDIEADLKPSLQHKSRATITSLDPWPSYCEQLASQVNVDAIRTAKTKIWIDAMHGSAAGGMTRLLGNRVIELRGQRDPLFGGLPPEPLPPQLAATMATIQTDPAPLKVGLVFDGDGDRIAGIDGAGRFLSPQILIPILIDHLAARRQRRGEVVKTVSGSELFAKVAQLHHLAISETAIGFKYIADRMLSTKVLLGGEESGGIGYSGHIPERDGMLSALFLLEAIASTGQDLNAIYHDLQRRTGYTSFYNRRDLKLSDLAQSQTLMQRLQAQPPRLILGSAVSDHNQLDGHKFRLADGSWLLIRASGTEPVLRLYCEALNRDHVEALLDWAVSQLA